MADTGVGQKLAAILAADVPCHARAMADDAVATPLEMNAMRRVFRQHVEAEGGRLADVEGELFLAIFPAADSAVRAAVDARETIASRQLQVATHVTAAPLANRLCLRMGIGLGEVFEKADGSIYGPAVDIATRLRKLAEPGWVVVSEEARADAEPNADFGFVAADEQAVKQLPDGARAFRVEGRSSDRPATRPRWLGPVVTVTGMVVVLVAVLAFTGGIHASVYKIMMWLIGIDGE